MTSVAEEPSLPASATPDSRRLRDLAASLVASWPSELGTEIALTGSVARGLADEHSDVELNCWADVIPSEGARHAWLARGGAEEVTLDETPSPAGVLWADCNIGETWVEVGWQTLDDLRLRIVEILSGEVLSHARLVLAEIVSTAVPLRTHGVLADLRAQLAEYPDVVRRRLLVESVGHWCVPSHRWALLHRGDAFTLAARLADDMHRVLRIVFALNRQWEPDWKWIRARLDTLSVTPTGLSDRLDAIVAAMPSEASIVMSRELILDTLDLVPPSPDVERARETIRRSLDERAP